MKRLLRNNLSVFLLGTLLLGILAVYYRSYYQAVFQKNKVELRPLRMPTGWGYQILIGGRPFIRQTTIPGVAGNQGFASQAKALKVGSLVVTKIKARQFPPSITLHELDSLHVLN